VIALAVTRINTEVMNKAITTALGRLVAGFSGGAMSHYLFVPMTVQAQAQSATKEIRAGKFVLVDDNGLPRGAFAIGTKFDDRPVLEVIDNKGHVWRARMSR
jgi:hypothetical protein